MGTNITTTTETTTTSTTTTTITHVPNSSTAWVVIIYISILTDSIYLERLIYISSLYLYITTTTTTTTR